MTTAKIEFLDSGREPRCEPDPDFPHGMTVIENDLGVRRRPHPPCDTIDIVATTGKGCTFQLPYPSPRCGLIVVECDTCHKRTALTVAGRIDDPRVLRMICK